MSVRQCPAAWWQHACKCTLIECRRRYPVRSLNDVLAARSEYMVLYCAMHLGKTVAHRYQKRYRELRSCDLRRRAVAYLKRNSQGAARRLASGPVLAGSPVASGVLGAAALWLRARRDAVLLAVGVRSCCGGCVRSQRWSSRSWRSWSAS